MELLTVESCPLENAPNLKFILLECGKACKSGETPRQVYKRIEPLFSDDIDRLWLMNRIETIQFNMFSQGILAGVGRDFPFEFRVYP